MGFIVWWFVTFTKRHKSNCCSKTDAHREIKLPFMFCKHGPENEGYGLQNNSVCCSENSCYIIYQTLLQTLDATS
jgi:hypothetical protein